MTMSLLFEPGLKLTLDDVRAAVERNQLEALLRMVNVNVGPEGVRTVEGAARLLMAKRRNHLRLRERRLRIARVDAKSSPRSLRSREAQSFSAFEPETAICSSENFDRFIRCLLFSSRTAAKGTILWF
jgi:predicted metal-dependent hydrolase